MYDVPINSDFSEIVAYNNPLFPAYLREGILSVYPNYRAACHWHMDLEFLYMYKGEMQYNVNGSIVSLSAGQGIFVNSRCLHYGFSDEKTECSFLCVLLHPNLLSTNSYFTEHILHPFLYNDELPFLLLHPGIVWQNQILNRLCEMYDKKNEALEIIQGFTEILYLLLTNAKPSDRISSGYRQSDLDSLTRMIGYVQQHFMEKITLSDLTREGCCSKTKCNELFRSHIGLSPTMYLIRYRLEKGVDLLRNTDKTITQIAYQCGFSSASYFCECFSRHNGLSPKQYRLHLSNSSSHEREEQ